MELKREADFDALMTEAAAASRGYQPAFGMQMRRELASAFLRNGRRDSARNVIHDSEEASRDVANIGERVVHLRKLAELLLLLESEQYGERLAEYHDPVFVTVAAMVGADAAIKAGRRDDAERLVSQAIASSRGDGAKPHRAFLIAWTLEASSLAGVTTFDPQLVQQAASLARQMPAGDDKSIAMRQVVTALAQLGRLDEARSMLEGVLDDEERRTASEAVARALVRNGDSVAALALLAIYQEDDLDRYSILSSIGEGLGDHYEPAMLAALDGALKSADRLEVRVNAIETLRKAGQLAAAGELLSNTLQLALAARDDNDEVLSRLGAELLAAGRENEALALAREASDPHTKTFSLIAVTKDRLSRKRTEGVGDLLIEAASAEEKVSEADLRAAGYREIGGVFRSMGHPEAMSYFRRSLAEATAGGKYGSDTVADVAEELVALGRLHDARTVADRYCEEGDRLRVYTAVVLKHSGLLARSPAFED